MIFFISFLNERTCWRMKGKQRHLVWVWLCAIGLFAVSVCDGANVRNLRSTRVDIVQETASTPSGATTSGNRRWWTGETLQRRMMHNILGYPCVLLLGANGTTYGCSRLCFSSLLFVTFFFAFCLFFLITNNKHINASTSMQSRGMR